MAEDTLDWALRLTGNQLLHQARLLTDLRDVPNVNANELKLSQVIVNLLTNAAQALTGERAANEVCVATWTDEDGSAVIEVEDNGRGMSEDVRLAVDGPPTTRRSSTDRRARPMIQRYSFAGGLIFSTCADPPSAARRTIGRTPAGAEPRLHQVCDLEKAHRECRATSAFAVERSRRQPVVLSHIEALILSHVVEQSVAGRGGAPSPTPRTFPRCTSTQPGRSTRSRATTASAVSRASMASPR